MEEKVVNKREHTRGINQYVEARRDQTGPAAPFWNQNLLHFQNLHLCNRSVTMQNSKRLSKILFINK